MEIERWKKSNISRNNESGKKNPRIIEIKVGLIVIVQIYAFSIFILKE